MAAARWRDRSADAAARRLVLTAAANQSPQRGVAVPAGDNATESSPA